MDIGLFGGTFNPVHNGHLGITRHVRKAFGLEKIILFPSASPPHKPHYNLAPARDRLEMVQACVREIHGFEASDIELKRKGPSFTIDTIKAFLKDADHQYVLLMGSDAFFDITTWKKKQEIFKAVPVIVMVRKSKTPDPPAASFIDENISKGYTRKNHRFVHESMQDIIMCHVPRIDISSTMVRQRIKDKGSIAGLVPAPVERFIIEKDLYT